MTTKHLLGAGFAFALIVSLLPALASAQVKAASPAQPQASAPASTAGSDDGGLIYRGPLPSLVRPVDANNGQYKTNDAGEAVTWNTDVAVARFGEETVRRIIGRDLKACAKVAIQKDASKLLRTRSEQLDGQRADDRKTVKRDLKVAAGSTVVGGAGGFVYGPVYGLINLFGSTIPSLAMQHAYGKLLKSDDDLKAYNIALSQFFLANSDLWLDEDDGWCHYMIGYVNTYGSAVRFTAADSPAPASPAGPPAPSAAVPAAPAPAAPAPVVPQPPAPASRTSQDF